MKVIKRDEVLKYINERIREERIADSYHDLKLFCKVEEINVTKQRIKKFLRTKAIEDGVNLNEDTAEVKPVDLVNVDTNLIKHSTEKLIREMKMSRYKYRREDLQYFNDLFRIYTTKCKIIGVIFSMLAGRRMVDAELMESLDITFTADDVLLSDVERLLVPLIRNYVLALDVKFKAEQMETYLTPVVDVAAMGKDGVHYNELLPNEDLQDYFGLSFDQSQFIALTDKQRKDIEEQTVENFKHYLIDNIDD